MKIKPDSGCATLALAFVILNSGLTMGFAQGSLTPPGPPGPVMKTLEQVEPRTPISALPFTITNSGSYYLTTNLTGVASSSGIIIRTNDVTIDLNGFVFALTFNSTLL